MRKRWMTICLAALLAVGSTGGELKVRDVFREMPDSIMPYLSRNNRLDFIDFMDSNMKAEVKNGLGGTSEMLTLADDSLTIRLSEASLATLFLADMPEPSDSVSQAIILVETFLTDSLHGESSVSYYSTDWHRLTATPRLSEALEKRVMAIRRQNILENDGKLLK